MAACETLRAPAANGAQFPPANRARRPARGPVGPRRAEKSAALCALCFGISPATLELAANFRKKRRRIKSRIAQFGYLQRAMRQSFIALPTGSNQRGITPRDSFLRRFALLWLEGAAPQHRLGVAQVPPDQELLLFRRRREIHYGHPPPQPQQ